MIEEVTKTVVYLDLSHFSMICRRVEQGHGMGVQGIKLLMKQMDQFYKHSLKITGASWDECYIKGTGDGAILCFDSPDAAHAFSVALHGKSEEHNETAEEDSQHRCFRVGIFTGPVILSPGEIIGGVVSSAARLEAAANTGEILMDIESWSNLPRDKKGLYGDRETVPGKNHDVPFQARRYRVCKPAPWDTDATDRTPELETGELKLILDTAEGLSNATQPPTNLETHITQALEAIDSCFSNQGKSGRGFQLEDILEAIATAIGHGAGIYNHSKSGHIGCGQIYHRTMLGILQRVQPVPVSPSRPAMGIELAAQWLSPIHEACPVVRHELAKDLVWELRFAFDSIGQLELFDEFTTALKWAHRDINALRGLMNEGTRISAEFSFGSSSIGLYFLRHMIEVLAYWAVQPSAPTELSANLSGLMAVLRESQRIHGANQGTLTVELLHVLNSI